MCEVGTGLRDSGREATLSPREELAEGKGGQKQGLAVQGAVTTLPPRPPQLRQKGRGALGKCAGIWKDLGGGQGGPGRGELTLIGSSL